MRPHAHPCVTVKTQNYEVVAMWGELHLSPHIRAPWERWLRTHKLLD